MLAIFAINVATFAGVENTLLLAEPKDMRLGMPRLRVTASADGGSVRLRLESDELALSVILWLDGADAAWSDNFFHLLPGGAPVDVQVRPATRMPPAEVARLRWRAL